MRIDLKGLTRSGELVVGRFRHIGLSYAGCAARRLTRLPPQTMIEFPSGGRALILEYVLGDDAYRARWIRRHDQLVEFWLDAPFAEDCRVLESLDRGIR